MTRQFFSKLLLTAIALFTLSTSWIYDLNKTHIYNPRWPPHAKFHDGQTLLFSFFLGLLTLGYTWRRGGHAEDNLRASLIFAALYWVTQALAIVVPNTAMIDPEFLAQTPRPFGLPGPQALVDIILLTAVFIAWLLGRPNRERASARAE